MRFLFLAMAMCVTAAAPAAGATITNGLVANWEFEGNTSDSVGSAHGTAFGGTSYVAGASGGQALSFDGTTGYVAIDGLSYAANAGPAQLTISAWVNTTYAGGGNNWAILDFDRSEFFHLSLNGAGRFLFATSSLSGGIDDFRSAGSSYNDGAWHHVTAVYDGTDKFLYVDGALEATRLDPHGGASLGRNRNRYGYLGDGSESASYNAGRNNRYYEGAIDDVALYHRALSPTEVVANYTGASLGAVPEPGSGLLALLGLGALCARRRRLA